MAKKDTLSALRRDLNKQIENQESIMKSLDNIEKKLNPDPENPQYILRPIEKTLEPITATYDTAGRMGRWMMTALVVVSLVSGIIWALFQIAASHISVKIP